MTNETEAPERIWICSHLGEYGDYYPEAVEAEGEWGGVAIPYVPEARIAELEANLAKAEDGLRECEREIDDYIRQEYPHDHPVQERYRQRDFAANPARTTLKELKGTDQ